MEERRSGQRAMTGLDGQLLAKRIFVALGHQIVDAHRLPIDKRGRQPSRVRPARWQVDAGSVRSGAFMSSKPPLLQEDGGIVGVAEPRSAFDHHVQNGLDVGRRGGDHAQDRRRSPFAAPAPRETSRLRACTSSNRRTFSIAMAAWSAKVFSSPICLSLNGFTSSAPDDQHADRLVLAHQRRGCHRAMAEAVGQRSADRELASHGRDVGDMHGHAIDERAARHPVARRPA